MKYFFTLMLCTIVSTLYCQDINVGVVGHWLMDDEDEMIDQSPTGLTGYISSGAYTEDRFGVEDQAIFFDGQFDYAVLDDALDDVTTIEDATFSISLWHRTGDIIPDLSPLICKYSHTLCGEVQRQWALLIATGEGIRFYFASTPEQENYRSISTIEPVAQELETWYHIVVTYDGSIDTNDGLDRVEIYVDNVLQADTINFNPGELGETIYEGDAPIGLMSYVSTDEDACGEFHAPGALDDIRIYDRVVSSEEVELLFEEGVLGVDEISEFDKSIDIRPTIIEDQTLTIRSSVQYMDLQMDIVSTRGQLVQSETFVQFNGEATIALDNLAGGSYIVLLKTADGLTSTKRVVIR